MEKEIRKKGARSRRQETGVRGQGAGKEIQHFRLLPLISTILAFFFLSPVPCSLSPAPCLLLPSAHAASVDDVVGDLQKKLSGINDVKGAFTQTSYLKDLEKTETYAGTFYIKKPSGLMWEYKTPRDEKVIINGTDTWIYKKSQKQAIRTKFNKGTYSQAPIALLTSMENLSADFDISLPEQDTLNLGPKRQMGVVRELIIKINSRNFPVKTMKVLDMYGNIITIELANIKTNSGLDDSLFTFTAPEGVEVFDMSQ